MICAGFDQREFKLDVFLNTESQRLSTTLERLKFERMPEFTDPSEPDNVGEKYRNLVRSLVRACPEARPNRAAAILRLAVMSLSRGQTALGASYRRLAYRIGRAKAITAIARKLAVLVYRTLKGGFLYKDPGAEAYDKRYRDHAVRRLRQRAEFLGFALISRQTGEVFEAGVS